MQAHIGGGDDTGRYVYVCGGLWVSERDADGGVESVRYGLCGSDGVEV